MSDAATFDILGLGCVAVDDLLYVESYPAPDKKIRIERQERQCGGLTGTALVAASRLGARCAYAGCLGNDDLSGFIIQDMKQKGIDMSHLVIKDEIHPINAVIIIDEKRKSRNIFFDISGVTDKYLQ